MLLSVSANLFRRRGFGIVSAFADACMSIFSFRIKSSARSLLSLDFGRTHSISRVSMLIVCSGCPNLSKDTDAEVAVDELL